MAVWTKKKVDSSEVNNGNQFNAGDGVRNTDINKIFQSSLYTQDFVENISIGTVTTTESGGDADAEVVLNSSGYPIINLVLPRGKQGEQGPAGSVGTLKKLLYSGYINAGGSATISPTSSSNLLIYIDASMGYSTIVNLSSKSSVDFTYKYYTSREYGSDYKSTQFYLTKGSMSRTKVFVDSSIIVTEGYSDGRFNISKSDDMSSHLIYVYELMF